MNSCDLTCSTLSCSKQCHESENCISGCSCPPGNVDNGLNECVPVDKCFCYLDNIKIAPGQTIQKECQEW
jgi:hypothetical protein